MTAKARRSLTEEEQALRRAGGEYLRGLRQAAGLSQRELALRVKLAHYVDVSQFERGERMVPPERYYDWATALNVDLRLFVLNLLRYYQPVAYAVLFGAQQQTRER